MQSLYSVELIAPIIFCKQEIC